MASVYKRGTVYWGRVTKSGKRYRRSLATSSRDVAEKRLRAWIGEMEAVAWGDRPPLPFSEAAMRFLDEHGPTLKPASLRRYESSLRSLAPRFEGKTLQGVSKADLAEFETLRRRDGATPSTIRRDLACLSSIFSFAMEHELVDANPVPAFLKSRKRRGLKEAPPRDRYLTAAEEDALIAAAGSELGAMIAFAIDTGLRLEEQLSLTWAQVDLAEGYVYVAQTKSGVPRRVPLLPRAGTFLATAPRHIRSPYVFHKRTTGERYDKRTRGLAAAQKRAGIAHLQWHDLRRTCGCRLIQDHGLKMHEVAMWLGHASVVQTERAYAFLNVDALRDKARGAQNWPQHARIT